MDKERAAKLARTAEGKSKPRKTIADEQIKELFSKLCIVRWSDGHETQAAIGDVFYTDEAYTRYKAYKDSGKPYPVAVSPLDNGAATVFPEDPEGERETFNTLCNGFTRALKQFVVDAGEPVDLSQLVNDEDAEELNRRADQSQRELQRIADEADKAIRGTL